MPTPPILGSWALASTNCRHQAKGFTIVELLISITVVGVLLFSVFGSVVYYFTQMTRNTLMIDMTTDSQNLLRNVAENIRFGVGVEHSNTISDPNAPAGGWNTSNASFIIVIAVPAVDASHNFIIDPNTGYPYDNELVYFKNGVQLMERTLANPGAAGNSLMTSCPSNLATNTCPADKFLADNVTNMVFTLYDQDNATTTDPTQARSVNVNLALSKSTFGGTINLTNNIRATLRNRFY